MPKAAKIWISMGVVLMSSTAVKAAMQKLWEYPCDVVMSVACLRLPTDMSISYQVPADFGIYNVASSGKNLVSIYVGSAPRLSGKLENPSLTLDSKNSRIRAFHSVADGKDRLDVVMVSKKSGEDTVHLFADFSEEDRDVIALIFSGLRPCVRQAPGQFQCPIASDVGKELAEWVREQHGASMH